MKLILTLTWILFVSLSANAQTWNCDTLRNIVKTTNHIQVHSYGNLYNIDDVDISMTYTARFVNIPDAWQLFLDDPTNSYIELTDGSSANFTLSEGVNPLYPEKMIFGMNHNEVPGHGQLIYTIQSLDNPSDSTNMVFDIVINPGSPLAIHEHDIDPEFYYAGQGNFHLPANIESIRVWSLSGAMISEAKNLNDAESIKLDIENNQIIIAEIQIENQFFSKKFLVID